MRLTRFILSALAVAVCVPSIGFSQYTPQWRAGDWWIVKEWTPGMASGWQHKRYDVLPPEKLGVVVCYVLQYGDTASPGSGSRTLYYIRCDNWRTVRSADYLENQGQIIGPATMDFPDGMFGPLPAEPQLPPFPLAASTSEDAVPAGDPLNPLRQSSRLADSAALNRYRTEPDTSGGRPLQPGDGTYMVLTELVTPSDTGGSDVPYRYDLQLWSVEYPWRLYWESGEPATNGRGRNVESRQWLIRSGHSAK